MWRFQAPQCGHHRRPLSHPSHWRFQWKFAGFAFDTAKSALASAVILEHATIECKPSITVDASDFAVGGFQDQFCDGSWHPLAFLSKKLTTAERKYATFDRELLALYLAIKQFCHYVEGLPFTAFTDHKPLVGAMTNAVDCSPRQTRHLSFVVEFTNDVQHVSGQDNVVANALSRIPTIAAVLSPEINYRQTCC